LEPGQEFTGSFIDENFTNWYQGEKNISSIFSIAAAIASILFDFHYPAGRYLLCIPNPEGFFR